MDKTALAITIAIALTCALLVFLRVYFGNQL